MEDETADFPGIAGGARQDLLLGVFEAWWSLIDGGLGLQRHAVCAVRAQHFRRRWELGRRAGSPWAYAFAFTEEIRQDACR